MLPGVKGCVMDVPVVANTPLKQGDVLFRIDPKPYQYVVDQDTAKLAEAEQNVKELKASLDQASAATERAKAQYQLAQQDYDRQFELFSKKVIAQVTLDTYTRNVETARQSVVEAEAGQERARLAYSSQVGGVNTQVAQLQAELSNAQFDLDQTVVQAPADGFVTQVALRPGVYVVPAPFRPAMTFINTDPKAQVLGAAFQQNALQRVQARDKAEIAFQSVPGRVFKGKVRIVLDAIAAGQLQASGTLQDFGAQEGESRAMALIDIVDDVSSYQIPVGSAAEVAVYTEHFEELSLLRKILLRMKSWQNYIFLEH
jgi:multidrug resistance efflux pump